jgi:peptide/nickel transport system substrate-binding protein
MKSPLRYSAVLLGTAIAAAGLTACQSPAEPDGPTSARIAVPIPQYLPATWDPAAGFVTTYLMPTQAVYESLMYVDTSDYSYQPLLAEEFSLSDDRRTMTIELRDDVDFADGVHLDADAVVSVLEAVFTAPDGYFGAVLAGPYSVEMEATGEYELVITTQKGIGRPFLDALSILPIVSPEALASPEGFADGPVGTGPYLVDEQVPDVSISFVRNPDYRDPDAFAFDALEFTVYEDTVAALNALKSGQLDVARLTPQLGAEAEASGLEIWTGAGVTTSLNWYDHATGARQPALNDVRVRQAISMAFDREAAAEAIGQGYATFSSQVFAHGQAEYIEGGDDRYPYDLDAAKALLAEAGYPDGFDLTLPVAPGTDVAPFVEQSLTDLGIRVTTEALQDGTPLESGQYALGIFPIGGTYAVSYLDDGGHMNPGTDGSVKGSADPKIADILDRLNNGSLEESAAASQELGEFLLEEQWYIPLIRVLDVWATVPGYVVEVGNAGGIPPSLRQLTSD